MTEIMIVDNNPHARHALKALLSQQADIQVTAEASNGLEAVKLIQQQPPDLIIMDVRMPIMDGLEATKLVKRDWSQIKIIILTMYPDSQTEALLAGADAFLVKGCALEEMISAIQALKTEGQNKQT